MAGIGYRIVPRDVSGIKLLDRLIDNMTGGKRKQALLNCGMQVIRSMEKTWRADGRPEKWAPLASSTIKRKKKAGKTKMMVWNGILRNSFEITASDDQLEVFTTVPYARAQQEGAEIHQKERHQVLAFSKSKNGMRFISHKKASMRRSKTVDVRFSHIGARVIKIPGRPFLLIQDEDRPIFQQIFRKTMYA